VSGEKVMKKIQTVLAFCFFLLSTYSANGTHIRAGEIRAERLNCSGLSYRITLIVYTNTASPTHPGGFIANGTLSWGEGSLQLPLINQVTIISASLKIGMVAFVQDITFSKEGTYTISYEEAHRNVSTVNIPNGNDNINFYVEDQLKVSATICDSSPSFLVPPIDQACRGKAFYHNLGASDKDGDSLSYSLIVPKGNDGASISGYADPNHSKFYAGLNYQQANSDQNGPPTFGIDATGLLTLDAPGAAGSYNIAIKVTQWKKNRADSTWQQFGFITRDMQIEVQDCSNRVPDLAAVQDICILAGEMATIDIKGKDPDLDNVIFEVFSDITSFSESPAIVKYAGIIQSTAPDTAHIGITWIPGCMRVREQPYQVVIKITDLPPDGGVTLTRFRSFNIKVMGPAPVVTQVQVNPALKKVTLRWDAYVCQNAESIQVWRRVARRNYNQPHCETGMQKSLQYSLLAELPPLSTTYEDRALAIGAQYCYRIVARFRDVASKISLDTCFIPQPARAPVITNVTVNKTDEVAGEIRISWRSPFDIDNVQYPPPYQYQVQRGNGFMGGEWTTVTRNNISDTTLLDKTTPTQDTAYHYRILLYVPSVASFAVDTSSTASSVKLSSHSSGTGIQLSWDEVVPWSTFLELHPYHYIYRSETSKEEDFVLIDSAAVNEDGPFYMDRGSYLGEGLDDHKTYFYKVETLGGYGNPKIKEPFENYSQIVSEHIPDTIPPCAPMVKVVRPDCGTLPCSDSYTNTIQWTEQTGAGCQNDIVYYEVYVSDSSTGTFTKWKDHVEGDVVTHSDLKDLSVCYKVVAVDWVGNQSSTEQSTCGENCPVIYMPNVFTPDASKGYNDTFQAFAATGDILNKECSRFIDFISLTVINREGLEIFKMSSDEGKIISWDGTDNGGKEMPGGVYYYLAKVRLKYSSEKTVNQEIKGWVHLIR